jgi:hypothetical protein
MKQKLLSSPETYGRVLAVVSYGVQDKGTTTLKRLLKSNLDVEFDDDSEIKVILQKSD